MHSAWSAFRRLIDRLNALLGIVAGLAIVLSCISISAEVYWRYYLKAPHTWSLEFNIFLLIGATFLAAGYAQMRRAHVGTEVLESLMPARWNRRRILLGDVLSFLLCAFVAVKVWQYAGQAWSEGWATDSVWAPPLWIPYSLMGFGMTLLALEYAVQILEEVAAARRVEGTATDDAP
ncbi:MAG TPA: TRAP transporter small permease [Casimicrobiaceae bacterium]|nr:TRAP transporter small permease [Casimicrobiaceae bacterium]